MWKEGTGKSSKLHYCFPDSYYQSAQENKHYEYNGSESPDEEQIKIKREDYYAAISKNIAWHLINTKRFFVRSYYIIIGRVG